MYKIDGISITSHVKQNCYVYTINVIEFSRGIYIDVYELEDLNFMGTRISII